LLIDDYEARRLADARKPLGVTYHLRMRALARRRAFAAGALVTVFGFAVPAVAQDRPIIVVDSDPAPARVEGGTFFLFGGSVVAMVRNRHTSPVLVTLRLWVFDQAGRLKGTNTYCTPDWFDRGTRRAIRVLLEVRDLVSTDNVSVGVVEVISDRVRWTALSSAEDGVSLARQRVLGSGGLLRLDERRTDGAPTVACPCECESAAASCEAQCFDTGLRAFTCTPVAFDGCSASCSCK